MPKDELEDYSNMNMNIDYIRSIKPVVAFHDFDGNEQGFRMTHLAMERTSEMMIDNATLRNLEIFTSNSGFKEGSLLSVIDKTSTSAGGRLLRSYLSAPSYNASKINKRLDVVEFLIKNEEIKDELLIKISSISDIERSLSRLSLGRSTPRDLASIRDTLIKITEIKKILNNYEIPEELKKHKKMLIENHEIIKELDSIVKDVV